MIISVSNQKGGLGKTTAALMLSQFFSFIRDYKVLVIDMDPQANLTSTVLSGTPGEFKSLKEVLIDGADIWDIITPTSIKGMDILPSNIGMEDLEAHLIVKANGPLLLKDLILDYKLNDRYDFIFIDTPPHLGRLTVNALVATDYVLIPLESKVYAADGVTKLLATIAETRKSLNPGLKILGAFLNRYESRTIVSRDIAESYANQIPDLLMQTKVRFNIRVEECIAAKELLYTYDPKSFGAKDFAALGEEVLARLALNETLISEPTRVGAHA